MFIDKNEMIVVEHLYVRESKCVFVCVGQDY